MNQRQRRHMALQATLPLAVAALAAVVVLALTGALDLWAGLGLLIALAVYFLFVSRRLTPAKKE